MKKFIFSVMALTAAASALAQSPIDAMEFSQNELRGSARFMSMAGAFTALGADLSALGQNPAGIGMYRGSDIGLTLGIDIASNKAEWPEGSQSNSNTLANLNNAGYVGTYLFGDNAQNSFSWGFSYNRLYRYNRHYSGGMSNMQSSLSNYIASITNGVDPSELWMSDGNQNLYPYDNYSDDAPDWMSVLFYNSGMISPETYEKDGQVYQDNVYRGLFQHGGTDGLGQKVDPSSGIANFEMQERGHADEYNITLGGSVMNLVYWGVGVGITTLDYQQDYWYNEAIERALVPAEDGGYQLGQANRSQLHSFRSISGSGANFKVGAIIKPINELRIGIAVHTPTYYTISSSSYAETVFNFTDPANSQYSFYGSESTPWDDYRFKLNTPWKLTVGVAGVIGGRAIISADYQYDAYSDMKISDDTGFAMSYVNDKISNYYKSTNTLRLGAEFRVTPQFSVRAGYSNVSSNAGKEYKDANDGNRGISVSTAGSNPSYTVNDATNYITFGLGYKVKGLYFDLAYVHKNRSSVLNAFTPFEDYDGVWTQAPSVKFTDNKSQIVATVGYRF